MRVPRRLILSCNVKLQAIAVLMAVLPISARASECGVSGPDYTAERIITVGDSTQRMMVYVSGAMVREETNTPNGMRVTIRDIRLGRTIIFDPHNGRSMVLPMPPRPPHLTKTRTLNEIGPDGSPVQIVQFQRDGSWLDLSRTYCRADRIMTRQTFVSLDPAGHEVEGTVIQDQIKVAPLSPSLFKPPRDAEPNRQE